MYQAPGKEVLSDDDTLELGATAKCEKRGMEESKPCLGGTSDLWQQPGSGSKSGDKSGCRGKSGKEGKGKANKRGKEKGAGKGKGKQRGKLDSKGKAESGGPAASGMAAGRAGKSKMPARDDSDWVWDDGLAMYWAKCTIEKMVHGM